MISTTPALDRNTANGYRMEAVADPIAAALIALGPLLYVYMPRPPVGGSQFLVYPALAGALTVVVALLARHCRVLSARVVVLLILLLLYSVAVGASLLLNPSALRLSAPAEIFRPILFGVFLLYGYFAALSAGRPAVERGLLWAASGILLGQFVLVIPQIAGIPIFDLLYDSGKARQFGRLMRVTGSLGNPNIFGWTVAQAAVIASVLAHGRARTWLLILATLLVVASGSRTMLLLFPFMFVAVHVLRDPGDVRVYIRYTMFACALLALFLFVIFYLGDYFPYLAQLKLVFATGSLASVSSFAARLSMWSTRFAEFRQGGTLAWFVGLGSRETNAVMDNDFLYVFFRYGGFGVVAHYGAVLCSILLLIRARRFTVAVCALEYMCFALVLGVLSETLASWHLPLLLFALIGMALGLDTPVEQSGATQRSPVLEASAMGL